MSDDSDGSGTKLGETIQTREILSYIVPGAAAMVACFLFDVGVAAGSGLANTPFLNVVRTLAPRVFEGEKASLAAQTAFLTALLVLAYVAGHVVASVSSLTLDRILIYRGYNYPYVSLLGLPNVRVGDQPCARCAGNDPSCECRRRASAASGFYKGSVFWLNALFLAEYVDLYLRLGLRYLMLALIAWIAIALVAKLVLNSRPARQMVPQFAQRFFYRVVGTYARPYELVARPLGTFMHSRSALERDVVSRFKAALRHHTSWDSDRVGSNNFWFAYLWLMRNEPRLFPSISSFLTQYGFARNLGSALYLSFLYCLASSWFQRYGANPPSSGPASLVPFVYLCVAFVMLWRYYYLYYCYFSKVVIRAFAYFSVTTEDALRATSAASSLCEEAAPPGLA